MTVITHPNQQTPAQRDAADAAEDVRGFKYTLDENAKAAKALASARQAAILGYLDRAIRRRRQTLRLTALFPYHSDFLAAAQLEDAPEDASELAAKDYIIRVATALKERAGGSV